MEKVFNITGACSPDEHYMVDLTSRLTEIKEMVDKGYYFAINRGRQYGKTTTLKLLKKYLDNDYIVVSLDFQSMSSDEFENEKSFVSGFARILWRKKYIHEYMSEAVRNQIKSFRNSNNSLSIGNFFDCLNDWCDEAEKPIVLIIDEVDNASNNGVFLDFLSQLRSNYLDRAENPTFQSVILAGVHDIRHIRQKIRPDTEHRLNSPWNIATDFKVDMSFSVHDISGMLADYEKDHNTGMNIQEISELIFSYTSGYPVLVSTLCKYMDEIFGFSKDGVLMSINNLMRQSTPLFDSLIGRLQDSENLRSFIYDILMYGKNFFYNPDDDVIKIAKMYGFIKADSGSVAISNKIFETRIYDWFISIEKTTSQIYSVGENDKNQFIINGVLDMEHILERFAIHFNDIYGSKPDKFKEDDGRKLFLLYLRPIINGVGNYYIEAETRNHRRTDVIVDYKGKQYIIELKIWHGEEYNQRGEKQLADYLDYYNIDKGYLLSFNFNKNKQTGINRINIKNKVLIEVVV